MAIEWFVHESLSASMLISLISLMAQLLGYYALKV